MSRITSCYFQNKCISFNKIISNFTTFHYFRNFILFKRITWN